MTFELMWKFCTLLCLPHSDAVFTGFVVNEGNVMKYPRVYDDENLFFAKGKYN